MNDNKVISLASRKVLSEDEIATQAVAAAEKAAADEAEEIISAEEQHKDANLSILRDARRLVENDVIEGVLVIGRQKNGKLFYTDIAPSKSSLQAEDFIAYVGILECMKTELVALAQMAPAIIGDGSIVNPHITQVTITEGTPA